MGFWVRTLKSHSKITKKHLKNDIFDQKIMILEFSTLLMGFVRFWKSRIRVSRVQISASASRGWSFGKNFFHCARICKCLLDLKYEYRLPLVWPTLGQSSASHSSAWLYLEKPNGKKNAWEGLRRLQLIGGILVLLRHFSFAEAFFCRPHFLFFLCSRMREW